MVERESGLKKLTTKRAKDAKNTVIKVCKYISN